MKTRLLIIIGIVGFTSLVIPTAFGWCPQNEDWPDAPCYAPYQDTSESFQDKIKEDWAKYYDYKGEYWMEQKRYDMEYALQTNSLYKWIDLAKSNQNVHQYYYLQGKAPDLNGKYVFTCDLYSDIKKYEEILSQDVVLKKFLQKFPHSTSSSGGIDESRPPQSHIFYEYEDDKISASLLMRVFEGDDKEPCIVPITYTLTYSENSIDIEIHNSDIDTTEILEFLGPLNFYQSPLKQLKSGVPVDEIQCKDGLQKVSRHDGIPACVTPETREELIERGWTKDHNSMLQKVLDLCGCQKSGGPCINPIFKWQNETHHIDSLNCKWSVMKAQENGIVLDLAAHPGFDKNNLFEQKQLQGILDHCERQELELPVNYPYLQYENETGHIITNESSIKEEHYSIEITGMKDIYRIGEQYDFSYVITGYGYSCGSKTISFPDQNGELVTISSSGLCSWECYEGELNKMKTRKSTYL